MSRRRSLTKDLKSAECDGSRLPLMSLVDHDLVGHDRRRALEHGPIIRGFVEAGLAADGVAGHDVSVRETPLSVGGLADPDLGDGMRTFEVDYEGLEGAKLGTDAGAAAWGIRLGHNCGSGESIRSRLFLPIGLLRLDCTLDREFMLSSVILGLDGGSVGGEASEEGAHDFLEKLF